VQLGVPTSELTVEDLFQLKKAGIRVNWRGKLVVPDGTTDAEGYLIVHEAVSAADVQDAAESKMVTATVATVESVTTSVNEITVPIEDDNITQPLLVGSG
jgi:hypothetical protein